jgi:hypothetical protein
MTAGHQNLEADVLVVGAGASGLPAAIGAARAGAKVIAIEEDPVVGGAPSDYYVCLFYGRPISGILGELEHLLKTKYSPTPRAQFFLPSGYQRAWRELIAAEPNLRVITGARAVGVLHEKGTDSPRAAGVVVEVIPGRCFDIKSAVTIDCTGSGIISEMAGCTVMYGREGKSDYGEPHAPESGDDRVQACTWMYFIQAIPGRQSKRQPGFRPRAVHVNVGIAARGEDELPQPEAVMSGEEDPELYLQWGCAVACRDTRDPISLAEAHEKAYEVIEPTLRELHENGYSVHLAPRIGVRECRRIRGEYVLAESDVTGGAFPEDTIAVADYGFDDWRPKRVSKQRGNVDEFGAATARYGIPYRSLVPAGVDGLLVAGKCMSGTHIAQSSFRVMPIAGSTGQAAGVAAALCAKHGVQPRRLEPDDVRTALRANRQHLQLSFEDG